MLGGFSCGGLDQRLPLLGSATLPSFVSVGLLAGCCGAGLALSLASLVLLLACVLLVLQ